MTTIIISALPYYTHDGTHTDYAMRRLCNTLRANDVAFDITPNCWGVWIDPATREVYRERVALIAMDGDLDAIRYAIAQFGIETHQIEMLFVRERPDASHILNAATRGAAEAMAQRYGGATVLPNGTVLSFVYETITAAEYAHS